MRNMSNMSKLLCSHHPTETPISNHMACRLYGQQGMYSIHAMRGGWVGVCRSMGQKVVNLGPIDKYFWDQGPMGKK